MRYLTLILSILTIQTFAQHSKLSTSNPIPRQGEEVTIYYSLSKADLSELEEKKEKTEEEWDLLRNNGAGKGSFEMTLSPTETGKIQIGPFSFVVCGKSYQTDTIILEVYPKLPSGIRDGVWMRYTERGNKGFLIVEQRISITSKVEKARNSISYTLDSDGVEYIELNTEKMEEYGLKVPSHSYRTSTENVDQKIGGDFFSGSVLLKTATYEIEKLPDFKGPLEIDKKFFNNFPNKAFIETASITN